MTRRAIAFENFGKGEVAQVVTGANVEGQASDPPLVVDVDDSDIEVLLSYPKSMSSF